MGISIYIISLLLYFSLISIRKISLLSPVSPFIFFSILYSIFPYLANIGVYPENVGILSLIKDDELINIHLLNVGISIIFFLIAYLISIRKLKTSFSNSLYSKSSCLHRGEKYLIVIYIIIYIIALYFGYKYPWGGWSGGGDLIERPEMINSFLANTKIFLSLIVVLLFCRLWVSKLTIALLLSFILLTLVEGSRTQLVSLLMTLLILMGANFKFKIKSILLTGLFIFISCLFIAWIALSRIGINLYADGALNIFYPFYMEGLYGSYMCLQIYDLMWVNSYMTPTFGLHLLFDPLLFLIPRIFFIYFGVDKDLATIYADWTMDANFYLDQPLGPYGGFYYIADAFLSFSFIGPPLISFIFGLISGKFQILGSNGLRGRYLYSLFLIGGLMVFIKHQISQSTHFMFVTFVCGIIIYMISGYARIYKKLN